MIHFVESEWENFFPNRGLIIEHDKAVWSLHLVLCFKWPKRRWFQCNWERSFQFAKPMLWMRLSLRPAGGWPLPWYRWPLARFEFASGVTPVDETREVVMSREHISCSVIYKMTEEQLAALPEK